LSEELLSAAKKKRPLNSEPSSRAAFMFHRVSLDSIRFMPAVSSFPSSPPGAQAEMAKNGCRYAVKNAIHIADSAFVRGPDHAIRLTHRKTDLRAKSLSRFEKSSIFLVAARFLHLELIDLGTQAYYKAVTILC